MRVIRKCLHTEKSRRYQSALDLEQELQKLWDQSDCTAYRYGARRMEESLVITVAGSRHGVGTTHIAMGLTAYLQKCGMSVVYEELNESGAVRQLAESRKSQADIYGIFHIRNIPMLPRYGEAVKLMPAGYQIRILDCGADPDLVQQVDADGYLLVCGGKPWEWEDSETAVQLGRSVQGLTVIYNQFCARLSFYQKQRYAGGLRMPYFADPFWGSRASDRVYRAIWNQWFGQKGGIVRSLFLEGIKRFW